MFNKEVYYSAIGGPRQKWLIGVSWKPLKKLRKYYFANDYERSYRHRQIKPRKPVSAYATVGRSYKQMMKEYNKQEHVSLKFVDGYMASIKKYRYYEMLKYYEDHVEKLVLLQKWVRSVIHRIKYREFYCKVLGVPACHDNPLGRVFPQGGYDFKKIQEDINRL